MYFVKQNLSHINTVGQPVEESISTNWYVSEFAWEVMTNQDFGTFPMQGGLGIGITNTYAVSGDLALSTDPPSPQLN